MPLFMADPKHYKTIAIRSEEIFSKAIQLKAKKILFVSVNVERQINTVEELSDAISKLIKRNNDDIQLVKIEMSRAMIFIWVRFQRKI